jgi:hypothetical protein
MLSKPLEAAKISFVSNTSGVSDMPRELNTFSTMFGERNVNDDGIESGSEVEPDESEEFDEQVQSISLPAPKIGGTEIRLPTPTMKGIALISCVSLSIVVKCTRFASYISY